MMIVKMLPSTFDMLFMISFAYLWLHIIVNVANLFAGIFQCFMNIGIWNTWMYGGEFDAV